MRARLASSEGRQRTGWASGDARDGKGQSLRAIKGGCKSSPFNCSPPFYGVKSTRACCGPRAAARIIHNIPPRPSGVRSPTVPATLTFTILLAAAGFSPGKTPFEKTFPPGVSQARVEGDQLV